MEVPTQRITMELPHHLLHTATLLLQDQQAEEVPSRAPHSALEVCSNMQMDLPGFSQRTDKTGREVNLTPSPRTANCGGESSSLPPPLHPRLPLRQAAEAARLEDHASIITSATQPSRDTTVTMETTTTSPLAHSTLTRPHTRCHHIPLTVLVLKKDASGGEGNAAPQAPSQPADPQRGGHSPGSAPTTTPQDRHLTLTPW